MGKFYTILVENKIAIENDSIKQSYPNFYFFLKNMEQRFLKLKKGGSKKNVWTTQPRPDRLIS